MNSLEWYMVLSPKKKLGEQPSEKAWQTDLDAQEAWSPQVAQDTETNSEDPRTGDWLSL